jgi:hypothetical protein
MVSFFRKKKKSELASSKTVTETVTPPSAPSKSSAAPPPPVVRAPKGPTTTTTHVAAPAQPPKQRKPQQQRVAKSSSYPSKKVGRKNFLAGSLRGSRSSVSRLPVSRLPAVQEETPGGGASMPSVVAPSSRHDNNNNNNNSTPDDLLTSLSFGHIEAEDGTPMEQDDDMDGGGAGVEILTPQAKDQVKRQLFEQAQRVSRMDSMEVTPDGIVHQPMSMDEEDANILIGVTTTTTTQLASTATTTPTTASSVSDESTILTPKQQSVVTHAARAGAAVVTPEVTTDPNAIRMEKVIPLPPKTSKVSKGKSPAELLEAPVPTRTISLEQNRASLVSPLTMAHIPERLPKVQQRTNNNIINDQEDAETLEEEDTLEQTADDTLTYDRTEDWSRAEEHEGEESTHRKLERHIENVAQKLMDSFQCSPEQVKQVSKNPIGAMSMFYDTMCKPEDFEDNPRRPYFNEDFAKRFVHRMLSTGLSLLHLQPPQTISNTTEEWKGRTVVMKIVPGSTGDSAEIQPKLQWTTMPGGTVSKAYMTSIPLLQMHSILTAGQQIAPEEISTVGDGESEADEDMCFLSITSASGKVYVFEANSVNERDDIAIGLRNVISRLAFHLVAGDHKASTELYEDDRTIQEDAEPGDLPALANPRLNMNRMAHLLLEAK